MLAAVHAFGLTGRPLPWLLLLLAACGGEQPGGRGTDGADGCLVNLQIACYCDSGAVGAQLCKPDGAFGACDCSRPPIVFDAGAGGQVDPGIGGGGSDMPQDPSPLYDTSGIRPATALPPGFHTITLSHGGATRSFDLYVPDDADNTHNVPLVVHFHGASVSPEQNELMTGYGQAGMQRGFAVAMPQGIGNSWNGGSACCAPANGSGVDDVGFARAVVQEASRQLWVNPARVYAAGFSNGSFLAQRLACEAADVFAAVAGSAGGISQQDWALICNPARPVPVVLYFGTQDETYALLADASYAFWKQHLGCSDATEPSYSHGTATCFTHTDCQGGAELTRCTVTDLAHCWPGAGHACLLQQTTAIDATSHSWEFFERFAN